MALGGVSAVQSRMAEISARFGAAPPGFSAALRAASAPAGAAGAPAIAPAAAVPAAASPGAPLRLLAPGASSAPAPQRTGAAGGWAQRLPADGQRWAADIERAARDAGVEPELLAALVRAESGFRPDARSHAGAIGLAQLMPATARGLGVDPTDPQQNLAGGARFLREQLDRFGSIELALAAYNAGPTRVARAGGVPAIAETQTYVARVTGYYRELKGAL